MKPEYIVSACLAGHNCRHDGGSKPCAEIIELVEAGAAITVCPESLAGLPRPRLPSEQRNGRVVSRDGQDLTAEFEAGASRALEIALASGCKKAILKAKSPSCGLGKIYDGSFSGRTIAGNGVFTQMLLQNGFDVADETSFR